LSSCFDPPPDINYSRRQERRDSVVILARSSTWYSRTCSVCMKQIPGYKSQWLYIIP